MFASDVKIPAASRAILSEQWEVSSALARTTLAALEKLVALNLGMARTILDESSSTAKRLLSARDTQEFFSLATTQSQPAMERIASYNSSVANIMSGMQEELSEELQSHMTEANAKVAALVDEFGKSLPAGSENAMEMLKSVMSNAQDGYTRVTESGKQAVQAAQEGLESATRQQRPETGKPTGRKH